MRGRAVRFAAPHRIELIDEEVPEPEMGQALVRTLYSGISAGTELLAYRGEIDPSLPLDEELPALAGRTFSYPFSYGYSAVGTIERSRCTLPEGIQVFAFQPHRNRFVAGEDELVVIEGEDPRLATLFPLVETALQVTLDAGPRLHDLVAVTGLGPVGMLICLLFERAGASVVASEPVLWRRQTARSLGINAVGPEEVEAAVRSETAGRGVSLLVEASGNPEALAKGLPLLGHEGEALVCSWYGTKPATLRLGASFHRRRLSIRSSQVSSIPTVLANRWDMARRRSVTRALLSELPLKALATHEFSFEHAAEAFAAIDRGLAGLLHAALRHG